MKISHIIALVVIAVAVAMIVTTVDDASQYVSFNEAYQLAQNGNENKIHVVGTLKKNAAGEIQEMKYDPARNPNFFSFTLVDKDNREETVIYNNPKPNDFERSEQVVVIGRVINEQFVAEKILLKCPSKYQENEIDMDEVEKGKDA